MKKGQAEAVLRDLIKVRSTRRGKCSVAIQFHIQLLSVIQLESESESESEYNTYSFLYSPHLLIPQYFIFFNINISSSFRSPVLKLTHANDSWLKGLKTCIPKSYLSEKKIDSLDKKSGGYDTLDSSTKLRVLTFLCDEVLGTE